LLAKSDFVDQCCRLFGGLTNDIKRKAPFYWSDFRDAFSLQSFASVAFLYFACLSPIITFGGLLGDATGNNIVIIVKSLYVQHVVKLFSKFIKLGLHFISIHLERV